MKETVHLQATCIKETTDAILVLLDSGEKIWIPKSQISDESEVLGGDDYGTLIISEWIAIEKKLV